MFSKILIANRGEIACRVMHTAQRMGIHCVAIYSEADQYSLHVKQADSAYLIGPAPSQESYLHITKILEIAKQAKVEAIHPGYGFLSENSQFAAQCEQMGIIFIGPSVEAIKLMGDKAAAKALMERAKIPMVSGYHEKAQDLNSLTQAAEKIGYPILIKAAAGGGGKGMRIVENASQLKNSIESAKREAMSSFADDRLLLEKYLTNPRHIEIQIMADHHGNCIYLWERDCSIQRRHQKILEEAPAFGLTNELRENIGKAAVTAAKSINYTNAGTIEFLLSEDQHFYFMEMNTRLQVEHPVTEMITGLDLVSLQLKVASGESLGITQEQVKREGHAIEVRIYAEDPLHGFLPSIGKITHLTLPMKSQHIRIDTGITAGDRITPYYDPMLAKLIVWDKSRQQSIVRLQQALSEWQMTGIKSNISYLHAITTLEAFVAGKLSTQFIDNYHQQLVSQLNANNDLFLALACCYLLEKQRQQRSASADRYSPWAVYDAWQLNQESRQTINLKIADQDFQLTATFMTNGYCIEVGDKTFEISHVIQENSQLKLQVNQLPVNTVIIEESNQLTIFCEGNAQTVKSIDRWKRYDSNEETAGHLRAPMPGTIVAVMTKKGQSVAPGDRLLILEAMKMEHTIIAPAAGIIKAIHYDKGDQVEEGTELLTFEAHHEPTKKNQTG